MSIEAILSDLVDKVPKAIGAILVDWEGEAVMEHCHCAPYDIRFIAAHEVIILGHLKKMQGSAFSGEVEDVVITSDSGFLIIGCVNQEYSLVLNVERGGSEAVSLYHLRTALTELKKEI